MEIYNEEYVYQVLMNDIDRQVFYDKCDNDDFDPFQQIWEWCGEKFGNDMWYHTYSEYNDCDIFAFKKDEHRTWFLMRWSS